jgi:hypothetical protein
MIEVEIQNDGYIYETMPVFFAEKGSISFKENEENRI